LRQSRQAVTIAGQSNPAVKSLANIALPFVLISCANLAADRWDEEEKVSTPAPEQPQEPVEAPELPAEEPDEELKLVDPNTTSELMKDENKKTVIGPAPVDVPAPESDSAIDLQPTIPAPPEED